MNDKYLIIYTNKKTGKYDHFETYPKTICSEDELKEKIATWNNANNSTIANYHTNDIFTDFVEDISNVTQNKRLISSLKSIVDSIHTNICELESWKDDITELLENITND